MDNLPSPVVPEILPNPFYTDCCVDRRFNVFADTDTMASHIIAAINTLMAAVMNDATSAEIALASDTSASRRPTLPAWQGHAFPPE